jgi:hypothetical protein
MEITLEATLNQRKKEAFHQPIQQALSRGNDT